jgi:hypothetical protein
MRALTILALALLAAIVAVLLLLGRRVRDHAPPQTICCRPENARRHSSVRRRATFFTPRDEVLASMTSWRAIPI